VPGLPPIIADPGVVDEREAAVLTTGDFMHSHLVSSMRWPDGTVSVVCGRCHASAVGVNYGAARTALADEPSCP